MAALAGALCAQSSKPFLANRSSEPAADEFSLERAIAFMDDAAQMWNARHGCVTCHTNGLYLIARAERSTRARPYRETRQLAAAYLEDYVVKGEKPKGQRGAVEGIVTAASALAVSDMATHGRLSTSTRSALDHIWQRQDPDGSWSGWLKCRWPPYEIDDHFGVTLAALALGSAPASYRRRPHVRQAEQRLRSYLDSHPAANLHHKGMLLWVATGLDGVVSDEQRNGWLRELRAIQREDGGWRLTDLGGEGWRRPEDAPGALPSDAYATGFAVFALRQGSVSPDDPAVQRGLRWLRSRQRQSGRWFVRSPRRDGKHYISHAATQFAVMAFLACDEH